MIKHRLLKEMAEMEKHQMFCGQKLEGNYDILVVGTFDPDDASGPKYNASDWFYGFASNRFWYLLPMMVGGYSLCKLEMDVSNNKLVELWQNFCLQNRIVITDLIKGINARRRLKDKLDTSLNLKLLESGGKYDLFDFENAFKNAQFSKILFTRSRWNAALGIDIIAMIKIAAEKVLKNHLAKDGVICNVHTPRDFNPNGSYSISREEVLSIWKKRLGYNN